MKNMLIRTLVISSVIAVGPGLIIACDHEHHAHDAHDGTRDPHDHVGSPGPLAPHAGGVDSAKHSIVAARCDREERCSNIGTGKDYESRDACASKLDGKTGSDLNTQDCSAGVNQPNLEECLAKIRAEDCGSPLDTLSRLSACRKGAICIDS